MKNEVNRALVVKKKLTILFAALCSCVTGAWAFEQHCDDGHGGWVWINFEGNVQPKPSEFYVIDPNCIEGDVIIPERITTYYGAFYCRELNVVGVGFDAFNGCPTINSISLPATVRYIDRFAFYNSSIKTVTFAEDSQLDTIGVCAFNQCYNLTSFTIPAKVTFIGKSAFSDSGLKTLYVEAMVAPSIRTNAFPPGVTAYVPKGADYSSWEQGGVIIEQELNGSGTKEDPYQILSYGNLVWFAKQVNSGKTNLCAELVKDIVYVTQYGAWTPIGSNTGYQGVFNGNGHTISGLAIGDATSMNSNVGLFGKINGGHVHHVGLKDGSMFGNDHIGAICGDFVSGEIDHCFVMDGTITYRGGLAGGLVGVCGNGANLHDSYSTMSVTVSSGYKADATTVGLACGEVSGTVTNCYVQSNTQSSYAVIGKQSGTAVVVDMMTKPSSAFASGEVCYLLNRGTTDGTQAFYQTLGTDNCPVQDNTHNTVYASKEEGGVVFGNAQPQYNLIYRDLLEPTCETVGYAQTGWEDPQTGIIYTDVACTEEMNQAIAVRYAPLVVNPVTPNSTMTIKERATYSNVPFAWAAEWKFTSSDESGVFSKKDAEFTVMDAEVSNARIKFYIGAGALEDHAHVRFIVYVNDSKVWENDDVYGANIIDSEQFSYCPLTDLHRGDKIKVEVRRNVVKPHNNTFAASLEYCSSHCGYYSDITVKADNVRKANGADDPAFTWSVTSGTVLEDFPLQDITVTRTQSGEEDGKYTLTPSCPDGANPHYNITFVDGQLEIVSSIHHAKTDPDCEHTGWSREFWEDAQTNKIYAEDTKITELNRDEIIAYEKLTSPCFDPLDDLGWNDYPGGDNGAAFLVVFPSSMYETPKGKYTVYGENVTEARLCVTVDVGSRINLLSFFEDLNTEKFEYTYQDKTYQVNYPLLEETKTKKTIYIPLTDLDLKYGDEITIAAPLSAEFLEYGNDFVFNITAVLQYASSNCGENDGKTRLHLSGSPVIADKPWDGTTAVAPSAIDLSGVAFEGLKAEDESKIQLTATAVYDKAEVGDNHTVTVTYNYSVTDDSFDDAYILPEDQTATVSGVKIIYPQAVTDAKLAAKQALTDKAGNTPSEAVQAIVSEYRDKIDAVTLTDNVETTTQLIEVIKVEGLSKIEEQQAREAEPVDEWVTVRTDGAAGNWNTICLERNITTIDGATFWTISGQDATSFILDEVTEPEAGQGYLIRFTAAELKVKYGDQVAANPVTATDGNPIQGTFTQIDFDQEGQNELVGNYVVYNNQLCPVEAWVGLLAHRAYVVADLVPNNVPAPAPGRARAYMPKPKETPTGIGQWNKEQGQRTGKFLHNGQLIIVKDNQMFNAQGMKL